MSSVSNTALRALDDDNVVLVDPTVDLGAAGEANTGDDFLDMMDA